MIFCQIKVCLNLVKVGIPNILAEHMAIQLTDCSGGI